MRQGTAPWPLRQPGHGGGKVILIVDDGADNLVALGELLQGAGYRVKVAKAGATALRLAAQSPPALILLDVMMPDMDGYQVLAQLRCGDATRDIPVVFLTGLDANEEIGRAFDAGIDDYITKPIRPFVVLARVHNQLLVSQARRGLRDQNQALESEVERRLRDLELTQEVSLRALAHLAETRDNETGKHIQRTQAYVRHLATRLAQQARFAAALPPEQIERLARSAPLHDIGKVGIPDAILHKPCKLTADEWAIMKTHTLLGSEAITLAERDSKATVDFLELTKEVVRWHHERWDGAGYPDGLAGEAIPLSARIMALADVFDALISRRVYKEPLPPAAVRRIITEERGSQFDPHIADVFLAHLAEFEAIARRHGLDA